MKWIFLFLWLIVAVVTGLVLAAVIQRETLSITIVVASLLILWPPLRLINSAYASVAAEVKQEMVLYWVGWLIWLPTLVAFDRAWRAWQGDLQFNATGTRRILAYMLNHLGDWFGASAVAVILALIASLLAWLALRLILKHGNYLYRAGFSLI